MHGRYIKSGFGDGPVVKTQQAGLHSRIIQVSETGGLHCLLRRTAGLGVQTVVAAKTVLLQDLINHFASLAAEVLLIKMDPVALAGQSAMIAGCRRGGYFWR